MIILIISKHRASQAGLRAKGDPTQHIHGHIHASQYNYLTLNFCLFGSKGQKAKSGLGALRVKGQ